MGGKEARIPQKDKADLAPADDGFEVVKAHIETVLVRMCGRWGEPTGGSGVFFVQEPDELVQSGDAMGYPKETDFDNHYHDGDEHWISFEGRGTATSEGTQYRVGVGDCVATRMGHHHDFPLVDEPISAVFVETTLRGAKRRGHLWDYRDGKTIPETD